MKYLGGCHCGQVKFEVEVDTTQVLDCNCSMCFKKGQLLTFAPEENFKLLSGENSLKEYTFNQHVIRHIFCTKCGIHSFGRGTAPDSNEVVAINVRCLDNFDLTTVEIAPYDGKAL